IYVRGSRILKSTINRLEGVSEEFWVVIQIFMANFVMHMIISEQLLISTLSCQNYMSEVIVFGSGKILYAYAPSLLLHNILRSLMSIKESSKNTFPLCKFSYTNFFCVCYRDLLQENIKSQFFLTHFVVL